jgi:outer membrane protein OmpA-like peptidoglycan-associated protein
MGVGMEVKEDNPYTLSIGDLMACLLMIFILLLAATLLQLQITTGATVDRAQKVKDITNDYQNIREDLYHALYEEFKDDLPKWGAEIYKETLTIRFKEPSIYFDTGKDALKSEFKVVLRDFFPRYVNLLHQEKYRELIDEIRIEGHTSSEWALDTKGKDPYFLNMKLSQGRTRSVLEFCLGEIGNPDLRAWVRSKITANGLSSSKLIMNSGGEDKEASRRVEFRVRTDAEKRIGNILKLGILD